MMNHRTQNLYCSNQSESNLYISCISSLDIFPGIFCCLIQDRVPAFSPEKAKAFIEKEMGCPIEVVFKEFEDRPIAAASLGQVFLTVHFCQHL
jgi:hypothetical protein